MSESITKNIILYGRKSMQNSLLSGFINSQPDLNCQYLHNPHWDDALYDCHRDTMVLIDAGLRQCTELHQLLSKIDSKRKKIRVAFFDVNEEHQKELMLAWPIVYGIFYSDCNQQLLIEGINGIFNDELWIPRKLLFAYLQRQRVRPAVYDGHQFKISVREVQILRCMIQGNNNNKIAERLCLSPHTVKSHIYNIMRKLGTKTRIDMILWAQKNISNYLKK